MPRNPLWTADVPVWVSRPTADGKIADVTMKGGMFLAVVVLIQANVVLWSCIGLIVAVLQVANLF